MSDDYLRAIMRVGAILGVDGLHEAPAPDAPLTWHIGPGPVVRFYRGSTCIADLQMQPDQFMRFARDVLAEAGR